MKRKLVVNDGRSEREVLLVGPIVIGRDPSCHISDLDPLLSRRHAEFVPRPSGLLVRVRYSTANGSAVAGSGFFSTHNGLLSFPPRITSQKGIGRAVGDTLVGS